MCCPQRIEIGLMSKRSTEFIFYVYNLFGSVGLRNNGLTSGSVDMIGLKT